MYLPETLLCDCIDPNWKPFLPLPGVRNLPCCCPQNAGETDFARGAGERQHHANSQPKLSCREDFELERGDSQDEKEDKHSLPWSAHAETCLPTSGSPPLWADNQFHILEMQTGRQKGGSDEESYALPASFLLLYPYGKVKSGATRTGFPYALI